MFIQCSPDATKLHKRESVPHFLAVALSGPLAACALLPGTGPRSGDVDANATAGIRSTASLPYALVDVSADTIGPLSQPNLITFKGAFADKRPKQIQVVGVGDVLNISIFEAQPGGLFTPGQSAGARPGNFVDVPPKRSISVVIFTCLRASNSGLRTDHTGHSGHYRCSLGQSRD